MSVSSKTLRFDRADIVWGGGYLITAACLPFLAPLGSLASPEPAFSLLYLCCFLSLFHFLFKSKLRSLTNYILLFTLIFIAGLGMRLLYAWYYPPGQEIQNAIWLGLLQLQGVDPTTIKPGISSLAGLTSGPLADLLAQMPFLENFTVAGPLTMLFWKGAAWLAPTLTGFKLIQIICDCLVFGFLAQILLKKGLPAIWAVLYWLNPLVLCASAGSGGAETLALVFLTLGMVAFLSQRFWAGFLCFGLSGAVQLPFLLLGFLFLSKKSVRTFPLLFLPTILATAFFGVDATYHNFTAFFSQPVQIPFSLSSVLTTINCDYTATIITILCCACVGLSYLLCSRFLHSLYASVACMTLLLPGPLTGALCLMAMITALFPSRAWLFLMATLPVTISLAEQLYAAGQANGSIWAAWLPYTPFCILLAWGLWRRQDRLAHRISYGPAESLCVLIPTHDDAVHLVQCVETIRRVAAYSELDVDILLADAGSTDGTVEQARELGVLLQTTSPGRNNQIRDALPTIKADAVLVLPVDCLLENDSLAKILNTLQRNRHSLGGALGMRFAFSDPALRLVSLTAALRARFFGLSFANQGQFFRRRALVSAGGYPQQSFMDDLELSIRMQRCEPTLYLGGGVRASRRDWSQTNYAVLAAQRSLTFLRYILSRKWTPPRKPSGRCADI